MPMIGAAVSLAGHDSDLRDCRLGIGMEQLGPVADDSRPLLMGSGHVAGDIGEGEEGNVEGVAEPDEPGGLVGGVDVEDAGVEPGIVGDDADGLPMIRMKATTMFFAQSSWGSKISPLSATAMIIFFMSYTRLALSGMIVSSSGHSRSAAVRAGG